ncbi:MAG: redoxin domain-containing protein [Candidatus Aenigmarchaeota archaeon]|nr:redoxin domain-containing protein [Candidatus Aenigmarchaeota archaeon]
MKIWILLLAVFLAAGCVQQQEGAQDEAVAQQESPAEISPAASPQTIAKNYYRYDRAAYEQALSGGKIVFLDFYASWCPICNAEKPDIVQAFNEIDYDNVVGFQVHYNDDQTNDDDRSLAREFGITYQHTKIIIKDGTVALKSLEVFSADRVKAEIAGLV